MKFFVAIALLAAVASAYVLPGNLHLTPQELAEVNEIMAAIHSPSTDPTTAVMLEQMLFEILGVAPVKPPVILPAMIDDFEPPHASPVIVDFPLPEGAVEETPIAPVAPPAPAAAASPLVQIIVNVNQQVGAAPSPVQVDQVGEPSPVHVVEENVMAPEPVIIGELPEFVPKPDPVIIGELPVAVPLPEPVIIGELPEVVALPEAVVVAPIIVAPAVNAPEILN